MKRKGWMAGLLLMGCLAAGQAHAADDGVDVLYAGSLVNLMEHGVGPAFEQASGLHFRGYAAGSKALANQIRGGLRHADVFISASPDVNQQLMGAANGAHVSWYANFAASPLRIGYNPQSQFAPAFKTQRWDQVLQTPGLRLGRTDPKLDPKGAFTIQLMTRAADFYHEPDLVAKTLGAPDNPAQVLPEETLVGRLQSGQLDAGFFYSTETTSLGLPSVAPPPELEVRANYTLTILTDAPHADAAARFVSFLLGEQGRALMAAQGLEVVAPAVSGDAQTVPAPVRGALGVAQ